MFSLGKILATVVTLSATAALVGWLTRDEGLPMVRVYTSKDKGEPTLWLEGWNLRSRNFRFEWVQQPEAADLLLIDGAEMAQELALSHILPWPGSSPSQLLSWHGRPVALNIPQPEAIGLVLPGVQTSFNNLRQMFIEVKKNGKSPLALPTDDAAVSSALLFADGALQLTGPAGIAFADLEVDQKLLRKTLDILHEAAFEKGMLPRNCSMDCALRLWKEGRAQGLLAPKGFLPTDGGDPFIPRKAFVKGSPRQALAIAFTVQSRSDSRREIAQLLARNIPTAASDIVIPDLSIALAYRNFELAAMRALGEMFEGLSTPQEVADRVVFEAAKLDPRKR